MNKLTRSQIIEYMIDCLGYSEEDIVDLLGYSEEDIDAGTSSPLKEVTDTSTSSLWGDLSDAQKLECANYSK